MARKSSSAGARRIHENAVKLNGEGKRLCRVKFYEACFAQIEAFELFAHRAEPVCVAIGSDDQSILSRVARERGRLSSRSGAQIQNSITRLHVEKQRDRLRSFVVN